MFIIDGSGILNAQYYGQMNAKPEERMQASDATIYYIRHIVNKYHPRYLVVVLDQNREFTFRKKLYKEYKANRPATEPELRRQKEMLVQKLQQNHIPMLMSPYYEADDFAGTLVKQYSKTESIILISKDQDYLQLVNENTYLWLIKSKQKIQELAKEYGEQLKVDDKMYAFTPEMTKKAYQLDPMQIVDLKALNGDISDNIPGVKGLGKAAIPLLQHYGTINDMYLEMEYVPEAKIKKKWKMEMNINPSRYDMLKEQKAMAFLSKKLAKIYQNIDLPLDISQYKI